MRRQVRHLEPERVARAILDALPDGEDLLLLMDYDGTLSPIVSDPARAGLPGEVRPSLLALAASGRVHPGIVSGRSLADVQSRLGMDGMIYAGCHGLDIRAAGAEFVHPEAEANRWTIEEVAAELARQVEKIRGVLVEPKGFAVAVHFRNMTASATPRLQEALRRVIGPRKAGLTLLRGKKVVEVLAAGDWDKGRSVLWIREVVERRTGRDVHTVYLGDDVTDELAFRRLGEAATTVRVGGRAKTYAAYRVARVADVHRLLAILAARLGTPAAG
jgi:trehalose-phosphatase